MAQSNRPIDFYRPPIGRAEKAAVNRALARGWLTSGPECARFEEEMRKFLGVQCALATSSGTAALHLALLAAGVSTGDEVLTSPYTFVASAEVIAHCGARPVFVDVEPGGYTIDPAGIPPKITGRTRAVIPVGIGGLPCRAPEIRRLARRHKIKVIEDAAHSLGASLNGKPIGRWAEATAFSFYSTKNLTTGEGGMVVTDRASWDKKMRLLARHGITKGTWDRYGNRAWTYNVSALGYKYNMSDLSAALGRAQLRRFERLQRKRERVHGWYRMLAADLPGISFPEPLPGGKSAYHLLLVRLTDHTLINNRDRILTALTQRQIGVSVHFIPLHLMTYFRRHYGYRPGDFPEAEAGSRATFSLPFYPEMTKGDVRYVLEVLRQTLQRYG
jgi:dTDP-4-amino-4,6-dideoxygalactose transaminase